MLSKKVKIALIPIKRGNMGGDFVKQRKYNFFEKMKELNNENVDYINIDNITDDGIVSCNDDTLPVIKYLRTQEIDGIFLVFIDFGCESAAVKIASAFDKPVLIWGERDTIDLDSGDRLSNDSQCGIIAATKVLQLANVKFTYIVNSYLNDEKLKNGLDNFSRVVSVVKAIRNMKIAAIGTRPAAFMSVMANEANLLNKFGIEIEPIHPSSLSSLMDEIQLRDDDEYKDAAIEFAQRVDISETAKERFERSIAYKLAVKKTMQDGGFDAAAISCWNEMPRAVGVNSCLVVSELTNMGYPISCEGDINGAISLALIAAVDFNRSTTFFPDITIRHPENDNADLLWHCGPFPYGLKKEDSKAKLVDGYCNWELQRGPLTITRFDSLNDNYVLFAGEGKTVDGPKTHGSYVWFEADNWEKWERKLVYGPYIHHVACLYGHYADILKEACKYIDGLVFDHPDSDYFPAFME